MLSRGIPILTTQVSGAEEIITDGYTGYMASDSKELLQKLEILCTCYTEMRVHCAAKVNAEYNIDSIAQDYIQTWVG